MKFSALVLGIAAAMVLPLAAAEEVVTTRGMAATYRGAVNEALITALEQHSGVLISSQQKSRLVAGQTAETANGVADSRVAINDQITNEMKKWADGKISGYTVTSEEYDKNDGQYRVEVVVRFPSPIVVGLNPANRRRMAVVPFRPANGDSISWYGANESSAGWTSALADKLNERMTQTRKFTMVDRKFDAEVNAELARLTGANASKADTVRLNQKLGTDYLVVGDVKFFPVVAPGVNPLTGQALPMTSQKFAEVSYRVLLAPTGQLKWSDTVVIDALQFPANDIGSFVSATAEGAAQMIADAMMANILPFEVVGVTKAGSIVIGEGGKSLCEGERFTVFALGETLSDSRTGEVLDEIEEPVGEVEITRVSEKMSYAKVIGGDPALIVKGCRLRRPKVVPAQEGTVAPPPVTTVGGNGTGGVVTPF